jgi:mannitol/fructose-specific phosphotransferase system IIA component (Ntr-type)
MTCPTGVDFASVDGEPVHILMGILAPQRRPSEHLKVLARVSRMLREESTRAQLLAATHPEALMASLTASTD